MLMPRLTRCSLLEWNTRDTHTHTHINLSILIYVSYSIRSNKNQSAIRRVFSLSLPSRFRRFFLCCGKNETPTYYRYTLPITWAMILIVFRQSSMLILQCLAMTKSNQITSITTGADCGQTSQIAKCFIN